MRRRSGQRGYTAVEVLSAMMLLAIGAAGVIGMQKVTIQGGTDARRFDIATNIANEWLEKLQRDSSFWTQPNLLTTNTNTTTDTKYLRDVTAGVCNGVNYCFPGVAGVRTVPPANARGDSIDSFAYDAIGRAIGPYAAADMNTYAHFCVQYRLNYYANPTLGPAGLIRAEVRVIFNRLEYGPIPDCTALPVNPDTLPAAGFRYHFVYAETFIRRNPIQ